MPVNVEIPVEKWAGSIRQITLGATAAEGGTRSHTITVGGETTLPFLGFDGQDAQSARDRHRGARRQSRRGVARAAHQSLGRCAWAMSLPGPRLPRAPAPT